MFKNFRISAINYQGFSDDQVETFFWLLVNDDKEKTYNALEILEIYRNKLAKKIAMEILEACTSPTD